jgi:23S rRNA (cytidine1920-2'-O)/16S rRNA (cytidine1409-2'-O)-methyltransferase
LTHKKPLRGEAKLRFALDVFKVSVEGRVALDVGAAAGGFTRVLLQAGARLVYAVDAGHGQLLGSLRQDSRVVNLEQTNLADLDESLIPDEVQVVSVDVSYVSLALAVPQLERVQIASDAVLLALVKPQFELGLARSPASEQVLSAALDRAREAIDAGPWDVVSSIRSPIRGRKGSAEFLIHARRQ